MYLLHATDHRTLYLYLITCLPPIHPTIVHYKYMHNKREKKNIKTSEVNCSCTTLSCKLWWCVSSGFTQAEFAIHVMFSPFSRILPSVWTLPDEVREVVSSKTRFMYSSKPMMTPSMVESLS